SRRSPKLPRDDPTGTRWGPALGSATKRGRSPNRIEHARRTHIGGRNPVGEPPRRKEAGMATPRIAPMDAVVIQESGPPVESLAVRSEAVPEPGPGEALVEVHAAAVNPLDIANIAGLLGTPLPMIPGVDFAGVVVSDGERSGQEVWGSAPQLGMTRPGTHARFVVLPEAWLPRKPERLTRGEAGAVGRPYLAAWETMIEAGKLKPGETILITGGGGAVGQAAMSIADWRGARAIVAAAHRP